MCIDLYVLCSIIMYKLYVFLECSFFILCVDLMQGVSPGEAFSSLPSSMQGADEMEESNTELLQAPFTLTSPILDVGPEEQLPMSVLDREEVCILYIIYMACI